jgi:hypothetical protein
MQLSSNTPHRPSRQSGSVLFYVLIGVALFAALSFAVAQMMRGGGQAPTELKTAAASGVLQYADTVRTAVRAMQINGIDVNKICFDNAGWGNSDYDFAACSDAANKVFDSDGGAVIWEKNTGDAHNSNSWLFTGANGIKGIGTTCGNASCADLKMVLSGLSADTCLEINRQLGIDNPGGNPPTDAGYDQTPFTGTYTATATDDIGAGNAALENQPAGCFKTTAAPAAGQYVFYRVLISR